MGTTWFVTTYTEAEKTAPMLPVMTHKTIEIDKAGPISSTQGKKQIRVIGLVLTSIPNNKSFLLDCGKMVETRKQERINIFWLIGTRDNPSGEDTSLLVAVVWRALINNPDVKPTVRLLTLVQLSTINGHHDYDIVISNPSIMHSLTIGFAIKEVTVRLFGTMLVKLVEYFLCLLLPIFHLLNALCITIERL